jgi:predicted ester cyclase
MSIEQHKQISARVFSEIFTHQNLALVEEIFHPQYVQKPVGFTGHAGVRRFVEQLQTAFPDVQFELVGQIAEGDAVANLALMTGTHTGLLLGHIPPTQSEVMLPYVIVHRFVEGKIVEGVVISDQLNLMQQIGVVPTPVWAK